MSHIWVLPNNIYEACKGISAKITFIILSLIFTEKLF